MVDALVRNEPVPTVPAHFDAATVSLEPPLARYSLRARDAGQLDALLPGTLPRRIGTMADGVLCIGPDEWLWRAPAGTAMPDASGQPVSIVDVSERQIAIAVEGPRAVEVVQSGNPLDLANFPVGSGKRTIFEGVEILLIRESETRFVIEVWRSFAEFTWGVLVKAASEL